jgi:hypothetical protein
LAPTGKPTCFSEVSIFRVVEARIAPRAQELLAPKLR